MSRVSQVTNLLRVVDIIARPQGATIHEIMAEEDLSRSTVVRLLKTIGDHGFPLFDDRVPGSNEKTWKFAPGYVKKFPNISLPDMEITQSEVLALYLVVGESRIIRNTGLKAALDRLLVKLEACFSQDALQRLRKFSTLFVSSSKFTKDYTCKESIIEKLSSAILDCSVCVIRYHAFGEDTIKRFRIEPLHFFEHEGGLYAAVRTPLHDTIITLAVERIIELTKTQEIFSPPSDFDPEIWIGEAFGVTHGKTMDVQIRFAAEQARYVMEKQWCDQQKIIKNLDGSIILKMRTAGFRELSRWILSWGKAAEVLEPENLRKMVADEIEAMSVVYH